MDKHHSNWLLIFCLILALIGVFIAVNFYVIKKPAAPPGAPQNFPQIFADVNPGPKTTTILAPNGKMNLIVKEEKTKEGTTTDTFYTSTDAGGQIQIYSETLSDGSTISVPYNTFSPDNKYIFLKKTETLGVTYFVLKTDGNVFKNNEKTIDFLTLFNSKFPETPASDVTGWGGMTLIVINHDNGDGKVAHSYWYDVASNSFIPLSTKFN